MSSLLTAWIFFQPDEPTEVSTMASYKDGYEDILDPRRTRSDFKYALKARKDIPKYKYNHSRSPADVKKHVLNSDRVKYAIEQVGAKKKKK